MNSKALRQKVLDLAIRGKLVPQNPEDEPASVLLEKIREEKEQLVKEGKLKKEKNLSKVLEKSFIIPDNWIWGRLNDICLEFLVPQRDKPKIFSGNIPWCRIEDIEGKFLNGTKSNQFVSQETIDNMNLKINPVGSIICSCSASLGIQAIVTRPCCTNQTFIGLVPSKNIYNIYLYYYLMSQKKYFYEIAAGTTIPYISKNKFKELRIPIPPLNEQQYIVDKIEKIFKQIDILENSKEELQSLTKLSKNKILDLAIRGQLVSQNPDDEPASILLEKIRQEKEQMVKEGKLKSKDIKNDTVIFKGEDGLYYEQFKDGKVKCINDEIPFEVPEGWEWCRLVNIANDIFAGGDKPDDTVKQLDKTHTIPIYSNGVESEGLYGYTAIPKVQPPAITISARGTIGFTCIRYTPFVPIIRLITIIPNYNVNIKYISYIFRSKIIKSEGSSIPQLTVPKIKPQLIPLPPLNEQQRIVERIEQLFAQIEAIETALQ